MEKCLSEETERSLRSLDARLFLKGFCGMIGGFNFFYEIPSAIRKIKGGSLNAPMLGNEMWGAFYGMGAGVASLGLEYHLYNQAYQNGASWTLWAVPLATNIASGIYEYVRSRNSERK